MGFGPIEACLMPHRLNFRGPAEDTQTSPSKPYNCYTGLEPCVTPNPINLLGFGAIFCRARTLGPKPRGPRTPGPEDKNTQLNSMQTIYGWSQRLTNLSLGFARSLVVVRASEEIQGPSRMLWCQLHDHPTNTLGLAVHWGGISEFRIATKWS